MKIQLGNKKPFEAPWSMLPELIVEYSEYGTTYYKYYGVLAGAYKYHMCIEVKHFYDIPRYRDMRTDGTDSINSIQAPIGEPSPPLPCVEETNKDNT